MARAIAAGFVERGQIAGAELCFTNPGDANANAFLAAVPGARRLESAAAVLREAQQVWIAVKPQIVRQVAEAMRPSIRPDQLLVSVVAGVRLDSLAEWTGHCRLVRVSPNTPCLVGCGTSIWAGSPGVVEADCQQVQAQLLSLGSAYEVPERLIDPISGLTSCGPAFVMTIIEALADGAVKAGVPRAMANSLVLELVGGSIALVQQTGLHPAQLRDQVASPAGSTIEGLAALEQGGLRSALIQAVAQAARRATELGNLPS